MESYGCRSPDVARKRQWLTPPKPGALYVLIWRSVDVALCAVLPEHPEYFTAAGKGARPAIALQEDHTPAWGQIDRAGPSVGLRIGAGASEKA